MVLLHFQVGLGLYVILKWALRELEGPQQLLPPFEAKHLQTGVDKLAGSYLP